MVIHVYQYERSLGGYEAWLVGIWMGYMVLSKLCVNRGLCVVLATTETTGQPQGTFSGADVTTTYTGLFAWY